MDVFKFENPRSSSSLVVNHIRRCRIAVRPGPAKFVAPELVRPPKLRASRLQHSPCQRAFVQVIPKTFSRHLVEAHCSGARTESAKAVAIKHPKTVQLPASPFFGFAPKPNRYARHAKIQIS